MITIGTQCVVVRNRCAHVLQETNLIYSIAPRIPPGRSAFNRSVGWRLGWSEGRLVDGSVDGLMGLCSHLFLIILMICGHLLLMFFAIVGHILYAFWLVLRVWGHLAVMLGSRVDF